MSLSAVSILTCDTCDNVSAEESEDWSLIIVLWKSVFIDWGRRVRAAGITIPIVPGIMPIQTFASFKRRTAFSKTIIPKELIAMLEPIQDDDKKVREFGTKFVANMVREVLGAGLGIHGIHCCEFQFFFLLGPPSLERLVNELTRFGVDTMNLSKGTEMLLEELNFVATAEVVKPLPWRAVRYRPTPRRPSPMLIDSWNSRSLLLDELNPLDRFSGRIDSDRISPVLLIGTSSRMDDGVILYAFHPALRILMEADSQRIVAISRLR